MSRRAVRFAPSLASSGGRAAGIVDVEAEEGEVAHLGETIAITIGSDASVPYPSRDQDAIDAAPRRPWSDDPSVESGREALEWSIRENLRRESELSCISDSYRSGGSNRLSHISDSYRSGGSNRSGGSGTNYRSAEAPALDVSRESDRTPVLANTGAGFDGRKANAALAANDGRSLAAALAQSIRHHSRMIDGEAPLKRGKNTAKPAYDPYQDDDHVTLAPNVELRYGKREKRSRREEGAMAAMLRDYVANAGGERNEDGEGYERTVERQQERIERMGDESFSERFRSNISNWFSVGIDSSERGMDASVRFADGADDDTAVVAAAIASGEAVPGAALGVVGQAPKFVAPPASSFRTATRHPSRLPADQFGSERARLAAPRRMLAARKRHRRNDSFLRLMVAILCFGLSLAFAVVYGEGRFGLAVSTMAYERKVANRRDDSSSDYDDPALTAEEEVAFYPEWWESQRGIPDMAARGMKLSPTIEYHAADVSSPRAPERIETPFFWFVPRSGGNAIRTIMSRCLRLAEASEYGAGSEAHYLRIEEQEDRKFVNVDMSSSKGLEHAKELNLASSGVPDVVISSDIHGVLDVFNNRNRARVFAVLRHPIDRAISKYYADLGSDPDVAGMSLTQYIRSGSYRVDNNYLTRYLSGRYGGRLELKHLDVAREFLRRKFVIGLASDLPATANLFSHVFGWNKTAAALGLENVDICYNNIYNALSDKSPPSVEEGSEGWKLLVSQNWYDLKVYEYAEHLFQLQVDQLKLAGSAEAPSEVARDRGRLLSQ